MGLSGFQTAPHVRCRVYVIALMRMRAQLDLRIGDPVERARLEDRRGQAIETFDRRPAAALVRRLKSVR